MIPCSILLRLENVVLTSFGSAPAKRIFSASAPPKPASQSQYCLDLVQKRDYEHFLATLLLPREIRSAAFALRAFNVEIASIRDLVTDQTIGRMRMQFWRDAVESIYETSGSKAVPNHPVVHELKIAVNRHKLSRNLLDQLVTSREGALADKPFLSLEEVDKYSEKSISSLNYLLLECLAKPTGDSETSITGHARHAANQLGKAEGIVTLIRAIPHNAQRRRVMLPADLLSTHKISSESIIRGTAATDDKFKHIVQVLAGKAEASLENARFRQKFLTREEKLLMLPAVAVDRFLSRLNRSDCNVFHQNLLKRDSWLPVSFYLNKFKKTF